MTGAAGHRPRRPRWVVVAAGWLCALVAGALVALWAQQTDDWRTGLDWERILLARIPRPLPRPVDDVLLFVPWLGTNFTLAPVMVVTAGWLAARARRRDLAYHLLVTQIGSITLNLALKALFDRPRPEFWARRGQYALTAFPSGHAIAGVALLFTAAILLHRERGWRWPFAAAAVILAISLYSRLYLGVHWPTDVIGGGVVGAVWLAATLAAFPPANAKGTSLADNGRMRRSAHSDG